MDGDDRQDTPGQTSLKVIERDLNRAIGCGAQDADDESNEHQAVKRCIHDAHEPPRE
jgi:hypothetical protein